MRLIIALLFICSGFFSQVYSQDSTTKSFQSQRFLFYAGGAYAISMIGLQQLWYKDYPQSSFHTFNDNNEWQQIDKVGHAYSTYTLTKLSYDILNGSNKADSKRVVYLAGGTTLLFLTTIEFFDGFSKEWGFSWGDMIANTGGVVLFSAQELLFQKQYVRLKYSYLNTEYRKVRPNTFGETTLQSAFKDYNGQTYWASLNLNNFSSKIQPKWLNIAFGYGGGEMLYATIEGNKAISNLSPYRQYYLGLDFDFEKIPTGHKWLKAVFKVANCIKLPAPTLELSKNSVPIFHWIYF